MLRESNGGLASALFEQLSEAREKLEQTILAQQQNGTFKLFACSGLRAHALSRPEPKLASMCQGPSAGAREGGKPATLRTRWGMCTGRGAGGPGRPCSRLTLGAGCKQSSTAELLAARDMARPLPRPQRPTWPAENQKNFSCQSGQGRTTA